LRVQRGTNFSAGSQTWLAQIRELSGASQPERQWLQPARSEVPDYHERGLSAFRSAPCNDYGTAVLLAINVVLIFLGLTSTIYRVSIFARRDQQWPARGQKAIINGIVLLGIACVFLLIAQVFFLS
jgi:hypothetical protein